MLCKLIKLVVLSILSIIMITNSAQTTTIIIYGKGGVVLIPPKICPEQSDKKCAEIIFDGPTPQSTNEVSIRDSEGNLYRGILAEPFKKNIKAMQGKDINLIKIERVK